MIFLVLSPVLLAAIYRDEDKAKELGLTPKAYLNEYTFTASDINDELLLGPTYAVSKLLKKANMNLGDFDVFEFHEAFAGQIVANMKCLASDSFAKEKLYFDVMTDTKT